MPHYSLYASSVLSSLPLAGLATDNTPFAGLATDAIALAGLATDARSTLSSCSKACRWCCSSWMCFSFSSMPVVYSCGAARVRSGDEG